MNDEEDVELSIIMVSYNEAQYLKQSIESVINQSFNSWELLIGDDGSSDDSLSIIQSYCQKYPNKIKYYVMDRNDGVKIPSIRVSNNIKHGFSLARGKYFTILSGDDYLCDNNRFERNMNFFKQNPKVNATISNFKYVFVDSKNDYVVPSNLGVSRKLFWSGCYTHLSCFTFAKNCLNNLLPNFCDDTGLIFSIICTGKWAYFDVVDFAYRQRERSIMSSADKAQLSMLELLVYNDTRGINKYRLSSLARFCKPMHYIFKHRQEISATAQKYAIYLAQDNGGIITQLLSYKDISVAKKLQCRLKLFSATVFRYYFAGIRRIQKLFWLMFRRKNGN